MKLAVAGEITPQWGGLVEADFAGSNTLEQGYVSYKGIRDTEIVFGHTKVPFLRRNCYLTVPTRASSARLRIGLLSNKRAGVSARKIRGCS
ncbi:MAG: hypothetical protein EXS37_11050 [Opitutus sp.]|nr:hypothetical protein [Opitutus sp.]